MLRSPQRRLLFSLFPLAVLLSGVVLLATACFGAGEPQPSGPGNVEELPPEFAKLAEVWELLQREHIDAETFDPSVLTEGAIKGMLEATGDDHAVYLDPEHYSHQRQDIQGYFEGIGAEVGVRNGLITIIAPIADTPAEEAGVKPGDVILEIDGEKIDGWDLFRVISRIRGEQGTPVRLLVRRDRTGETEELEIIRGVIQLESVKLTMLVGRVGHLRITSFSGTSKDELQTALARFRRSQGVGLVVDVRNNPGGLVSSVVEVTSQFIDEGLVLYQLDAHGNRRDWNAEGEGMALDVPVVVLMNGFSASASEVFAGAIMAHNRAPTIGVKSFGKGSVNSLWPLSDGSAVNFTIGRWYKPDGRLIEGESIDPDIVLESSEDESEDIQLDLAIEELEKLIENSQATGIQLEPAVRGG